MVYYGETSIEFNKFISNGGTCCEEMRALCQVCMVEGPVSGGKEQCERWHLIRDHDSKKKPVKYISGEEFAQKGNCKDTVLRGSWPDMFRVYKENRHG